MNPPPFKPKLEILPDPQRELWSILQEIPVHFVLYGGTALALHLGHRQSIDFDFFSSESFHPETFHRTLTFCKNAEILQKTSNTLSLRVHLNGEIQLSFFGGLTFGRVGEPVLSPENQIQVASIEDLFATKLNVIYQRAEAKDYQDIAAILSLHQWNLEQGLGFAQAIYGQGFNSMLPLKALHYFEGGDLSTLSASTKLLLTEAVNSVRNIIPATCKSLKLSR